VHIIYNCSYLVINLDNESRIDQSKPAAIRHPSPYPWRVGCGYGHRHPGFNPCRSLGVIDGEDVVAAQILSVQVCVQYNGGANGSAGSSEYLLSVSGSIGAELEVIRRRSSSFLRLFEMLSFNISAIAGGMFGGTKSLVAKA
jgi:hypothetical protein